MDDINEVIRRLLLETRPENTKTLIFVLGDPSRAYFERGLTLESDSKSESSYGKGKGKGKVSSIESVVRCRDEIKVLFLNRMQYVFMFLTKLEAEKYVEYTNLILYGLDVLLGQETGKQGSANGSIFVLSAEQVRLANLTFDTLFKVKRKHELGTVKFVPFDGGSLVSRDLFQLEEYWRYIS